MKASIGAFERAVPSTSLERVRTNAARGFWPMLSSSTVSATGAVFVVGRVDRLLPWILL